jgi:type IV pilus assembly protein PilA
MTKWLRRLGCLFLVFGLVAAVAVPNLVEARKNGNETRAIGALGRIAAAQAIFREGDKEGDGNLDYGTLAELGEAGLIDAVLATGMKDGYLFESAYGATTSEFIWFAVASPVEPGHTGDRYWAINHEGVPYYTSEQPFEMNTVDCTMPPNVQPT